MAPEDEVGEAGEGDDVLQDELQRRRRATKDEKRDKGNKIEKGVEENAALK